MNKQANKQTNKKKIHQEQEVPLTNHFQTSMMKISNFTDPVPRNSTNYKNTKTTIENNSTQITIITVHYNM